MHGDCSGLVVVDGEITVGGFHFADWGDDGGGAAGKTFDDVASFGPGAPVIGGDGAFFGVVAQVGGDLEEGFAGYAGQERSREFGGDNGGGGPIIAGVDEHEVHAAHFFNVFVFVGVEPYDLVAAFFGGLGLGGEGGSVVAGEFSGTGATGGGPDVVFTQPHGDGFHPTGEVGTGGGGDDGVGVGGGGADP